jgi:anti-sigma regulatory factor (Ser/Thr protein kinase)
LTVRFDPSARAPMDARTAIAPLEGELDPQLYEDLRLIVSELVTNSVVHGPRREPVQLRLEIRDDGVVRGEVEDQGDGAVEIRDAAGEGGGFGLRMLDRVAERWGVHQGSTHVWFELRAR